MRKKQKENGNGLRSAFVFALLVVSILIFSLILKSYSTIKKSIYDGHHRFTIAVLRNDNSQVLSFYPANHEIDIYSFKGKESSFSDLELPIDTKIGSDISFNSDTFSSGLSSLLFNQKNNLIFWDKFRLLYFAKTVSQDLIKTSDISSSNASNLLVENEVQSENLSIQIVNATGESGYANRLSNLITNMGGNVILLSTSQRPQNYSEIQYSEDSYTVKRLSKYLNYKSAKNGRKQVADIIIIIGKDNINTSLF